MLRSLYTAATGMQAEQLKMDTIANNLANVNTTGFKRTRAEFQDLLSETIVQATPAGPQGGGQPAPLQVGLGVRTGSTTRSTAQGDMVSTQGQYDIAIEGNGFFRVQRSNGDIAFTRAGNFRVDETGRLVTQRGELLEPGITVPPDTIALTVQSDGTVLAKVPNRTDQTTLGRIDLTTFTNSGRARGDRRQPVPADGGQRSGAAGAPGRPGGRHAVAGVPGDVQRAGGRRDGRHDQHPAVVRDELQGHPDRRPDAAEADVAALAMIKVGHIALPVVAAVSVLLAVPLAARAAAGTRGGDAAATAEVAPVVRHALERALAAPGARLDSAVEERGAGRAPARLPRDRGRGRAADRGLGPIGGEGQRARVARRPLRELALGARARGRAGRGGHARAARGRCARRRLRHRGTRAASGPYARGDRAARRWLRARWPRARSSMARSSASRRCVRDRWSRWWSSAAR